MVNSKIKIVFLTIIIFIILFNINVSFVSAIEYHDCCDVSIDEDKLVEIYNNNIKENHCWGDTSLSDCIVNYEKRVVDGKELGIDEYRKILITNPIKECNDEIRLSKERFGGSCESVLYCDDIKAEYPDGLYNENSFFVDKSSEMFEVDFFEYDLDQLGKFRRSGFQYENLFVLSNSRFSYLQPKKELNTLEKEYNYVYNIAKEKCVNELNISEKFEIAGYLEANPLFQSCINSNIQLSREDKNLYNFYTNWIVGGGDNYIEGLAICEEKLGFQNDIGLVKFPGQHSISTCEESDIINGCCPGDHKDSKLDICCESGFTGYKNDDGRLFCVISQQDDEIISVNIELSKNELLLNGSDLIIATLVYTAINPVGESIPYANRLIFNGIVVESGTKQYSFNVKKLSEKTDSEGKLSVEISLKNADMDSLGISLDNIKVMVYSLDQPDFEQDETFFTLSLGEGIKIDSVKQLSKIKIWQNAPVKFKVIVNDPIHETKIFKLQSSTSFKIDDKQEDYIIYHTTKKNEFEFIWIAPQISTEVKMKYVKRLVDGLIKVGFVATEDILGNKLGKYGESSKDISQDFKNLNKIYNKMNLVVKTDIQTSGGKSLAESLVKTASEPYEYAQMGINSILWMEGTMGILGKPTAPLVTVLKSGLIGVNEWYKLVEDMETVAKDEKITLEVPLIISVEGLQSKTTDEITKIVSVEGFKMVSVD